MVYVYILAPKAPLLEKFMKKQGFESILGEKVAFLTSSLRKVGGGTDPFVPPRLGSGGHVPQCPPHSRLWLDPRQIGKWRPPEKSCCILGYNQCFSRAVSVSDLLSTATPIFKIVEQTPPEFFDSGRKIIFSPFSGKFIGPIFDYMFFRKKVEIFQNIRAPVFKTSFYCVLGNFFPKKPKNFWEMAPSAPFSIVLPKKC